MRNINEPQHAIELEKVVIGSCIVEPQCLVQTIEIIQVPETFYDTNHQIIYKALIAMFERGAIIDLFTLSNELKSNNQLEQVGGFYGISQIVDNLTTSAHVEEYARIITEKAILRQLASFGYTITSKAFKPETDAFELLDEVQQFAGKIAETIIKRQYISVSRSTDAVMTETETRMTTEVKVTGITTGFRYLNDITGGWNATDLIILAARPAVGKTAFLLNLAQAAASDPNNVTPVGIFSLEMSHDQLTRRLLASMADINLSDLTHGRLTPEQWKHLNETAQTLKNFPIYIDDTASMSILELRAKARRMVSVHRVGMIIVDYLQLMRGSNRNNNREQEVSEISRELKILAKTLQVPVIALAQLNRAVESRAENRPQLSDLRESGSIEQDADIVAFLYGHKPNEIAQNSELKANKYLFVAKNRHGSIGDLAYKFDGSRQRFYGEELLIMESPAHEVNKPKALPVNSISQPAFGNGLSSLPKPNFDNPFEF